MPTKIKSAGRILMIPVRYVKENPLRARVYYNNARTEALMNSIAQKGILEPLTVCGGADGSYVVISGGRRLRAARLLGIRAVPCVVVSANAECALFAALCAELNHEDLNYFETALCYEKLRCSFELTYPQTAQRVGVPLAELMEKVRLLQIAPRLRKTLIENALGEGYARLLARHGEEEQALLLERILTENLSLRAARAASDALKKPVRAGKGSIRACFKDATVFVNTIDRACSAMQAAELPAEIRRAETDEAVEYAIRIPK